MLLLFNYLITLHTHLLPSRVPHSPPLPSHRFSLDPSRTPTPVDMQIISLDTRGHQGIGKDHGIMHSRFTRVLRTFSQPMSPCHMEDEPMIYEVRTYTLRPGTVAEFEERYAKRLALREKHSKLGAFWHTEFGPLNQVIHVYPYDDLRHRTAVRDALAIDTARAQIPSGREFVVAQEAEIMIPAPFMHALGSRDYGTRNVYEMRTYTYAPGDLSKVLEAWAKAIPDREKFSPLAACWTSELGGLNKFVHTWVYKDLNERARVREESRKAGGAWPPQTGVRPIRQENKLLVPAAFSPVR